MCRPRDRQVHGPDQTMRGRVRGGCRPAAIASRMSGASSGEAAAEGADGVTIADPFGCREFGDTADHVRRRAPRSSDGLALISFNRVGSRFAAALDGPAMSGASSPPPRRLIRSGTSRISMACCRDRASSGVGHDSAAAERMTRETGWAELYAVDNGCQRVAAHHIAPEIVTAKLRRQAPAPRGHAAVAGRLSPSTATAIVARLGKHRRCLGGDQRFRGRGAGMRQPRGCLLRCAP